VVWINWNRKHGIIKRIFFQNSNQRKEKTPTFWKNGFSAEFLLKIFSLRFSSLYHQNKYLAAFFSYVFVRSFVPLKSGFKQIVLIIGITFDLGDRNWNTRYDIEIEWCLILTLFIIWCKHRWEWNWRLDGRKWNEIDGVHIIRYPYDIVI
jgi:hypothetical protein